MFLYPFEKSFVIDLSRSKALSHLILIGVVQMYSVDFEKGEHDMHPDTLVAIEECIIRNKGVPQSGSLFFLARIKLVLPVEGLIYPPIDGRL